MTRPAQRLLLISVVVGALGLALAPVAMAQNVNCGDISQSRAQSIYNSNPSDPNDLDSDGDSIACEATATTDTTTDTTTTTSQTANKTFASTGFEVWPIGLAGALCLGGALLLLRRRREA